MYGLEPCLNYYMITQLTRNISVHTLARSSAYPSGPEVELARLGNLRVVAPLGRWKRETVEKSRLEGTLGTEHLERFLNQALSLSLSHPGVVVLPTCSRYRRPCSPYWRDYSCIK